MKNLKSFHVYPRVPEKLKFYETLVDNLWWSWRIEALDVLRRGGPEKWREAGQNPLKLFCDLVSQHELERLAANESLLKQLEEVREQFDKEVLTKKSPEELGLPAGTTIAYFSMEYGIHESLPIFSGGLGILSGDHLKAASDFSLPLVAVGLFYRYGYFRQFLTNDGWQMEEYPETDIFYLPIKRVRDQNGNKIYIEIPSPMGLIKARAWRIDVGRVELYLLDTNLMDNPPEIREITSRLYAGEPHIRIAQEILLGIGGMKLLEKLGMFPTVCHLNEGHCSFVCIERLAQIIRHLNLTLEEAMEFLPRTNVFTTHTPVAAGYDRFDVNMVRPYLEPYTEIFHVPVEEIISWGQKGWKYDPSSKFCMFTFGLRFTQYCNGVSKLHGHVARRMWHHVWPDRPLEEVPIKHVTNGVHVTSWISIENHLLFERYIAPKWYLESEEAIKEGIDRIYEEELWRARELSRARLIRFCRYMMRKQYARRNAPQHILDEVGSVFDPDVLTIGFARRFTGYKRATLLLKDSERLKRLITSKQYPVQFVFAGKAHPKDEEGKNFIKQIVEFGRDNDVRHRFIFLENYDINIARHLVQGVDVWLNTPRRPFEACGTSGMKAAINGVLNCSVLDGWWCEAYREDRGWEIGGGKEYNDPVYQDEVEAQALYNTLEEDIIPLFYQNRRGDIPHLWVHMMKESMKVGIVNFSAKRMIKDYVNNYYSKASANYFELMNNNFEKLRNIVQQRKKLKKHWDKIKIGKPMKMGPSYFRVGQEFEVVVEVYLGELSPSDVSVELYLGKFKGYEEIEKSEVITMDVYQEAEEGLYIYKCKVKCGMSGRYGFNARIVPKGDDYLVFSPHFIKWSE